MLILNIATIHIKYMNAYIRDTYSTMSACRRERLQVVGAIQDYVFTHIGVPTANGKYVCSSPGSYYVTIYINKGATKS